MVGVSALTQSVGLRTSDWCCSLVVFLALETKFLLFWTRQERDSVLSRSTGHPAFTRSPSLSPTRPASTPPLASASPSAFQTASGPRNTWKCLQAQRSASEVPERAVVLGGDRFRGGWGFHGVLSGSGWGLSGPGSRRDMD